MNQSNTNMENRKDSPQKGKKYLKGDPLDNMIAKPKDSRKRNTAIEPDDIVGPMTPETEQVSKVAPLQKVPPPRITADLYLKEHLENWHISPSSTDPDPNSEYLFLWIGKFWSELGKVSDPEVKEKLRSEVYIWSQSKYTDSRAELRYIREVSSHIEYLLKFYCQSKPLKRFIGLNWRNGMLFLEEKRWSSIHDRSYFVTNIIHEEYDPTAAPDPLQLKYMFSAVGNNTQSMNLLRALFFRVIWPNKALQTGFYFVGLPGTGKSTFMEVIKALTPTKYVTHSGTELAADRFAVGSLVGKSILLIPELKHLTLGSKLILKSYMGRDSLSGRKMYDSKSTGESFVPEGLVVGSGNYNLLQVIGLDEALLSRIFPIPLNVQPSHRYAGVESILTRNLSSFVNWILFPNALVIKDQIRVSTEFINQRYQDSILSEFISLHLVYEQNSFTIRERMYDRYLQWNSQRVEIQNKREILSQGDFYTQLQTILERVFDIHVSIDSRPRIYQEGGGGGPIRPRVITHMVLRDVSPSSETEKVPYLAPKLSELGDTKYETVDPFEMPTLHPGELYIQKIKSYKELFRESETGPQDEQAYYEQVVKNYETDAKKYAERMTAEQGLRFPKAELDKLLQP